MQLKWLHQAQFAGFYAADQNGYYAEEGLKVTFVEGGVGVDLLAPVVDGTAQFAIADAANLTVARAKGKPLTAIGVVYRRSPLVFVSLAEAGIVRPEDIVGKSIRLTSDVAPAFHAMMARVGISPDQYTEADAPSDVAHFASGTPAVWGVYTNGLALAVQQGGYEINAIYPDDYGVHFYADSIFTTDDLIAAQPDLALRFLRATLKGWTYAIENSAEVGPMVAKYNAKADPALEIAKMMASLPLVNTGEDHIGWMKPDIWAGIAKTLREQNVLTGPLDVTQVYTMQFLQEIYK